MQHVKILSADSYMLIERRLRDLVGLRVDGKSEMLIRLPSIHSLDEENAAFESSIADAAHSFFGQRRFQGIRKPDSVAPRRLQFRCANRRDTLDIFPDRRGRRLDIDDALDDAQITLRKKLM